jgi:glycosyltransferase involved in cell wall biosynthesis
MTPAAAADRPLVSVCVATRNQDRYIERCVRSVLEQAPACDLEVLVGDDASNDATPNVLSALARQSDGRLQVYRHEGRLGAVGNIKFLLRRAKGEFIAHLDGDDYWLPSKLHEQVEALRSAPDAVAVYCNAWVVDERDEPQGMFNNRLPPQRFGLEQMLVRGNFLNHSSMVFRRCALDALLGLPEDYLDYRTHLCLARIGPLLYLDRPLAAYRRNSATSMVDGANEHVRELYWQALETGIAGVAPGVRREALADFLRRVVFRSARMRDPALFRYWCARARRIRAGR